jgi:hypothetical protein
MEEIMKKCEIVTIPAQKLKEILVAPANQNIFREATQRTESVLAQLRDARRVEPGQLKEPYNL